MLDRFWEWRRNRVIRKEFRKKWTSYLHEEEGIPKWKIFFMSNKVLVGYAIYHAYKGHINDIAQINNTPFN